MSIDNSKRLAVTETPIPGVLLVDLEVHGDNRGWFKENWQRAKMTSLGLPDFNPIQNNVSFNEKAGTTRGIHAEPWDKFISVAAGRIFGAWVDLRNGPTFGKVFTATLDQSRAIFIPRGVGNAFQTLEDNTSYTYLVNDHWSAAAQEQYTFLNLADETISIEWPIPLSQAQLSDRDRVHPRLAQVTPMPARKILVLGANGQLGSALRKQYRDHTAVEFAGRAEFDIDSDDVFANTNWKDYETVINAAAFTDVDAAESASGRRAAWQTNVSGVTRLARVAIENNLTLVHVSSDYVFDGLEELHSEEEPFSPLSVYGQTKAAADAVVSVTPKHYIVRASWVIGNGKNFVKTMASLAKMGAKPNVVNDQTGRLTFAEDIAATIRHLIQERAPYGTYNLSNAGRPQSWAEIASEVFTLVGADGTDVVGVSTEVYFDGKAAAPRPSKSTLDLTKLVNVGFTPVPAKERLERLLRDETKQ